MKNVIRTFAPILILLLTTAFRGDDRLKFYWGEMKIEFESGISLSKVIQSKPTKKLHYIIREDLIQEVGKRTTKLEINLVRRGTSIYANRYDDLLSDQTLMFDDIYSSLRVGDTILLQFTGVEGILPQIVGLKIKE
ncbi:hypothetical protein [Reichenbachiella sp.]|uniref:hypothetical protein n=1 Tax=Reichenbachiella sp. TaxID=2184521 RepID=UPI003B5BB94D